MSYSVYAKSESNELRSYLSVISKIKLLSIEEEKQLALEWFDNKNKTSAQSLVVSHLPLVVKLAYSYKGYGLSIMDLISEGNIGLMRAVNKFNPYNGNRLSTYAMWWIRAYITDFILKSWSMVKIGTLQGRKKLFFSLNKIKNKLGIVKDNLSKEDISLISDTTQISKRDVEEVNTLFYSRDLSLSSSINNDHNLSFENLLPSPSNNPEESFIVNQQESNNKVAVKHALKMLDEREREIILKRYFVDKPYSLEKIGQKLGISRERVRQIEKKALQKSRAFLSESFGDSIKYLT